jgi:hypothetical protein
MSMGSILSNLIVLERVEIIRVQMKTTLHRPFRKYINEFTIIIRQYKRKWYKIIGISVESPLLLKHPIQLVLNAEVSCQWKVIHFLHFAILP